MRAELDRLAGLEARLLEEVGRVTGLMEEKHARLEAAGVFRDYREVHREYARLAADGEAEALKRALFLQWYALSEPACFTGVFEIFNSAQTLVAREVDGSLMLIVGSPPYIFVGNIDAVQQPTLG